MIKEQHLNLGPEAAGADSPQRAALRDFCRGIMLVTVWSMLALHDIKQRYRRSIIGPFWITISAGILVGSLGFLYSVLFNQNIDTYLPFLAVGLIIWMFISTLLNEATTVFVSSEGMLKQIRLPLTVHVCRMVYRNLIIFAHNAVIIVFVMIWAQTPITWGLILIPAALILISFNGINVGLILGILSTRFRDIAQLVASIIQVIFFVTPIMWSPEILYGRGVNMTWIIEYNPAYYFIEIVRGPVLGSEISLNPWLVVLGISIVTWLLGIYSLVKFRHRVAYWL